jgi:hypothetical protein
METRWFEIWPPPIWMVQPVSRSSFQGDCESVDENGWFNLCDLLHFWSFNLLLDIKFEEIPYPKRETQNSLIPDQKTFAIYVPGTYFGSAFRCYRYDIPPGPVSWCQFNHSVGLAIRLTIFGNFLKYVCLYNHFSIPV